jgi:hypothetical protein
MEVHRPNGYTTLIDESDWIGKTLFLLPWYAAQLPGGKIYVVAKVRNQLTGKLLVLRLHREVMNPPADLDVDHREGPGLDNRRQNLRFCNDPQNQQNTATRGGASRFKGVSWNRRKGKWQVAFRCHKQYYFVGYFTDEAEAARAYNAAILPLAGEFARLNEAPGPAGRP